MKRHGSKMFAGRVALETQNLNATLEDMMYLMRSNDVESKRKKAELVQLMLDVDPSLVHATVPEKSRSKYDVACTALHYAARLGLVRVATVLLDNGAEVNPKNKTLRWTPLHEACYRNKYKMAKLLVERGADVNDCDTVHQLSPLLASFVVLDDHMKEARHSEKLAMYLIENGADIHHKSDESVTLLQFAIDKGFVTLTKHLLDSGIDVNFADSKGATPLLFAVYYRRAAIVELLIEKGAEVNCKTCEAILPFSTPKGTTPLHEAVFSGKEETIKLLLSKGADVNCKDDLGFAPASYTQNESIVQLLVENGAAKPELHGMTDMPSRVLDEMRGRSTYHHRDDEPLPEDEEDEDSD